MRTRSRSSRCASVPTSTTSSPSWSASMTAKPDSSLNQRRRRMTASPSKGAPGVVSSMASPRLVRLGDVLAPFVDAAWLTAHRDHVVPCDVRWYLDGRSGRAAYDGGHLPGAVFVDLERDLA